MATDKTVNKGFITDLSGNYLLPITRGELVLDNAGEIALFSDFFKVTTDHAGLMTAADKAALDVLAGSGGGTQSLTDVYAKLGNLNKGLLFNGTALNFYNASGNSTPIDIISSGEASIAINLLRDSNLALTNEVSLLLKAIHLTNIEKTSTILKSITVDKYGRVTAVDGASLTNSDIPNTLSNKTLTNCTTTTTATSDNAIVNKKYVDDKFASVNAVAIGSLKFAGPIASADAATDALKIGNVNNYYKVTGNFNLNVSTLYDTSGIPTNVTTISVKIGDTLIVYPDQTSQTSAKFVYIPSADDVATTISVIDEIDSTTNYGPKLGNVVLKFAEPFTVTAQQDVAYIELLEVSNTTDGYLSSTLYQSIINTLTNQAVSYTPTIVSNTSGSYVIGTLTVGTATNTLYGKNNISALTLENGVQTDTTLNPRLKFTETGVTDKYITFKSGDGVLVQKNGDNIEISSTNIVHTDSSKYLTITDRDTFKINIGTTSDGRVTEGLTDYNEFVTFKEAVFNSTTSFEKIPNSLYQNHNYASPNKNYYYGSDDLVEAITINI